jgi:hypothetical protein
MPLLFAWAGAAAIQRQGAALRNDSLASSSQELDVSPSASLQPIADASALTTSRAIFWAYAGYRPATEKLVLKGRSGAETSIAPGKTQDPLLGLKASLRMASAVEGAARILFSNPEANELPGARLFECSDFPAEETCSMSHSLPPKLKPNRLYIVQNDQYDFSALDKLAALMATADGQSGGDRREDLMQHHRGNNYRFVATDLFAHGIHQALWLDGDTCVVDAKAVKEWLDTPASMPLTVAERHDPGPVWPVWNDNKKTWPGTDHIAFDDPFVVAWLGKDPSCRTKFGTMYRGFNAGIMLFRLDQLRHVNMMTRMEKVLQEQIARIQNHRPWLWSVSVNQAPTIIAMYNYTTFADYGYNCREEHPENEEPPHCMIKHHEECWTSKERKQGEGIGVRTAAVITGTGERYWDLDAPS